MIEIPTASGLEGVGPNKSGITSIPAKDLGFGGLGNSVNTSPSASGGTLGPGGPSKKLGNTMSITNDVVASADTTMLDCPMGTLESDGING